MRGALEEAVGAMERQMLSDDALDQPYNEDMSKAIAACYRALGQNEEAEKWYRPSPHCP